MKIFVTFVNSLFLLINFCHSQINLFPHHTGDMWCFDFYNYVYWEMEHLKSEVTLDSIASNGDIYVTKINDCIEYPGYLPNEANLFDTCQYTIVDSNLVYSNHEFFGANYTYHGNYLKYKLDADSGETWIVATYPLNVNLEFYTMAKITSVYTSTIFNNPILCKNIKYFLTSDTSDTLGFERQCIETIASDFGTISYMHGNFGPSGYDLIGAILDDQAYGDTSLLTLIDKPTELFDQDFFLPQNFPNPFNSTTTIQFELKEYMEVKLNIYDLQGCLVKKLIGKPLLPGSHKIFWDGRNDNGQEVSTGLYFYSLRTSKYSQTKTMLLLK